MLVKLDNFECPSMFCLCLSLYSPTYHTYMLFNNIKNSAYLILIKLYKKFKYFCFTLISWVHAIFSILEQSPRDWETTIHQNVVLTVFHTQNIHFICGKLSELHFNASLVSNRGEKVMKWRKNCETNLSHSFPCFSNLLPGI